MLRLQQFVIFKEQSKNGKEEKQRLMRDKEKNGGSRGSNGEQPNKPRQPVFADQKVPIFTRLCCHLAFP